MLQPAEITGPGAADMAQWTRVPNTTPGESNTLFWALHKDTDTHIHINKKIFKRKDKKRYSKGLLEPAQWPGPSKPTEECFLLAFFRKADSLISSALNKRANKSKTHLDKHSPHSNYSLFFGGKF